MHNFHFLKKAILFTWALWWTLVFINDFSECLMQLGMTNAAWINDMNLPTIIMSLERFSFPEWLAFILYLVVILWGLACCVFFWRAALTRSNHFHYQRRVLRAFNLSMLLWFAFIVIDQFVMHPEYTLESTHMIQASFELMCLLVVFKLPDQLPTASS